MHPFSSRKVPQQSSRTLQLTITAEHPRVVCHSVPNHSYRISVAALFFVLMEYASGASLIERDHSFHFHFLPSVLGRSYQRQSTWFSLRNIVRPPYTNIIKQTSTLLKLLLLERRQGRKRLLKLFLFLNTWEVLRYFSDVID